MSDQVPLRPVPQNADHPLRLLDVVVPHGRDARLDHRVHLLGRTGLGRGDQQHALGERLQDPANGLSDRIAVHIYTSWKGGDWRLETGKNDLSLKYLAHLWKGGGWRLGKM